MQSVRQTGLATKRTVEASFQAPNMRGLRYLVYLNNSASGKRIVKTIDLCDQKTAP